MRLIIDTSKVTFTVSRDPQAKMEPGANPAQKRDRNTQMPLWTVQLVAMADDGAEVINVTVAGEQPPKVNAGQLVTPIDLQAIPWAQNGKNGTAFRAGELKLVAAGKSAA
ncbi:hypothetical protein [Amycolatopsis suaedae]|uniref:Regulatory protein n=1 Tax=Amycolatopsis suaedae TaxID=2510978 RepID=A0A4Q7J885_9PSEU|nr:hypothetical protein [Amycolatopsis suaedae]RZQ63419.1 hypothetical protein EWH70_13320 [Amycolatopsis suaedae]